MALPTEVTAPVRLALVVTLLAVKLATAVVEVTTRGAVPIATVEVICPEAFMVVNLPVVGVVAPIVVPSIVPLVTVTALIAS